MRHITSKLTSLVLCLLALHACSDSTSVTKPATKPIKANVGVQAVQAGTRTDSLTVVTLNMSVGWQAEDLVVKKLDDSLVVYTAMKDLYTQYKATLPSLRMMIQAQALKAHPADVIALQETQVMMAGDTESFSFVDTLLADLATIGGPTDWTIVRQNLNPITLNVPDSVGNRMKLNFWEGNVFLIRKGLTVLDSTSAIYNKAVNFSILAQPVGSHRGYEKIKVRTPGGATWQVFNTHLEVELLSLYNLEQGQELNSAAWDAWQALDTGAQVVVGDLNSLTGKGGVGSLTGSSSGFVDLWPLAGVKDSIAGWSCCIGAPQGSTQNYDRRIDYILARNFVRVANMERISLLQGEEWASDHAMLRATLVQQF